MFIDSLSSWMQTSFPTGGIAFFTGLALIVFLEAIAGIGTLVPGGPLLFSAGAFCSKDPESLPVIIASAAVAALLGDSLSFGLGRRSSQKLRPFFERYITPSIQQRCQQQLKRHFRLAIISGRLIGPARSFIPFLAGCSDLSWRHYLPTAVLSTLIWSMSYAGGGYWAAQKWRVLGLNIDTLFVLILSVGALFVFILPLHRIRPRTTNHRPLDKD